MLVAIKVPCVCRQPLRAGLSLRAGQIVAIRVGLAINCSLLSILFVCAIPPHAAGQLFDPLEQLPVRWQLAENDCRARVVRHDLDANGGYDGQPCEAVTLSAGHGTHLLLEYRIDPSRVIDEFTANLWVRVAHDHARVGVRVRYPFLHDPQTRRPVSVIVYGSQHRRPGKWDRLAISQLPRRLREKESALRVEFGGQIDLREPFVDAIVVDVYNQAGVSTVRLDDLSVDYLVPVGITASASRPALLTAADSDSQLPSTGLRTNQPDQSFDGLPIPIPFPTDRVLRIVEHRDEPLSYLKMLGFDAVLLARPPTAELLREASRDQMLVYAPPPTAPHPELESLLEPIAGWYLGTSQDKSDFNDVRQQRQRVENFPALWQRPSFVAPVEAWAAYATLVPALCYDLPPTNLGLSSTEEIDYIRDGRSRTVRPVQTVIGIPTSPPRGLQRQWDAFANHVGAPSVDDYGWHPLWLQTIRALSHSPQAIVFRSRNSLASGLAVDQKRAMAVGYLNRSIEAIGPFIARTVSSGTLRCTGANYDATRLSLGSTDVILVCSNNAGPATVLAGDGAVLEVQLPPAFANRVGWRISAMTAERLEISSQPQGPIAQIVSPDMVEILIVSTDTTLGPQLANSLARLARPAALDRWQLTTESLMQTRLDWDNAAAAGLVDRAARPTPWLVRAANTLSEGEPMYRSGDSAATIRQARRADAWTQRSRDALLVAMQPRQPIRQQFPTLLGPGAVHLHVAMLAELQTGQWSRNLLPSDSFDSPEQMQRTGWSHDQRSDAGAQVHVGLLRQPGNDPEAFLQVEVVANAGNRLKGGYAGTTVRVRSPVCQVPTGSLLRYRCRIRTLGFGGPFQGVLIYDVASGSELGMLTRSADDWQTVEIFRRVLGENAQLSFEVIGAGEVLIRDVNVQVWDETPQDPVRLRPLSAAGANVGVTR